MLSFKNITHIDGHATQAEGLRQALWMLACEEDCFTDQMVREAFTALLAALETEQEALRGTIEQLHREFYALQSVSLAAPDHRTLQ